MYYVQHDIHTRVTHGRVPHTTHITADHNRHGTRRCIVRGGEMAAPPWPTLKLVRKSPIRLRKAMYEMFSKPPFSVLAQAWLSSNRALSGNRALKIYLGGGCHLSASYIRYAIAIDSQRRRGGGMHIYRNRTCGRKAMVMRMAFQTSTAKHRRTKLFKL